MDIINSSVSHVVEDFADLNLEDGPVQIAFIGPMPEGERRKTLGEVVYDLDTGKTSWEQLSDDDKEALAIRDDKNTARPTLLHKMAENWASGDFRELSLDERKKIVLFLLDKAMPHANKRDDPILTVAIGYHRIDFVDFIIANRPRMLQDLLMSTDVKGMNCLHKAFKDTMLAAWKDLINWKRTDTLAKTMSMIIRLLERSGSAPITAKDDVGNTPIHYAMDYRLCHIPREYEYNGKEHKYEDIIRLLLKQAESGMKVEVLFNNKHQSPYRYHFYVKAGIENQNRKEKASEPPAQYTKPGGGEEMKNGLGGKGVPGKQVAGESVGRVPITEMSVQTVPHPKANVPSAPRGVPKPPRDPQQQGGLAVTPTVGAKEVDPVETKLATIVRRPTTSLDMENDEGRHKAVSEPKKASKTVSLENPKSQSKAEKIPWPGEEEKEAAKGILTFLKCFFIRNSTDRDAKDLLYGKVASGEMIIAPA
ncbi:hypothetical protein BDV06DRAFT_136263 [Aspergillus oleicola]